VPSSCSWLTIGRCLRWYTCMYVSACSPVSDVRSGWISWEISSRAIMGVQVSLVRRKTVPKWARLRKSLTRQFSFFHVELLLGQQAAVAQVGQPLELGQQGVILGRHLEARGGRRRGGGGRQLAGLELETVLLEVVPAVLD